METPSPYSPPQVELLGDLEEYGQIKIFSAKGRIGRLRYIAYSIGVAFVGYLILGLLVGVSSVVLGQEQAAFLVAAITALCFGCMMIISVLLTIQRCHDFDVTGWLSLILLLPLIPLIFWFIPGTAGGNRYGPPPPPNKSVAIIVILLLLVIMMIGILAAIAIPAYQEYVARAAAMR